MNQRVLSVFADYYQVLVADSEADWSNLPDLWTPQSVEARFAVGDDYLAFLTARNTTVPVHMWVGDTEPLRLAGGWDRVNEARIAVPSGALEVSGVTDRKSDAQVVPMARGEYSIRVYFKNLNDLAQDGLTGDDSYVVELWPAR